MQPQKTDLTHLPGSTPQSDHCVNTVLGSHCKLRKIIETPFSSPSQLLWKLQSEGWSGGGGGGGGCGNLQLIPFPPSSPLLICLKKNSQYVGVGEEGMWQRTPVPQQNKLSHNIIVYTKGHVNLMKDYWKTSPSAAVFKHGPRYCISMYLKALGDYKVWRPLFSQIMRTL